MIGFDKAAQELGVSQFTLNIYLDRPELYKHLCYSKGKKFIKDFEEFKEKADFVMRRCKPTKNRKKIFPNYLKAKSDFDIMGTG